MITRAQTTLEKFDRTKLVHKFHLALIAGLIRIK